MTSVRKSLALSFVQNYSVMFVQFGSGMILARLLTPAEVGVFAVASVLVSVIHNVRDFGVGDYLIQERELTREKLAVAFGINMAFATILAMLVTVFSGEIAAFFREPGLRNVMLVLAVSFFLIPFGSIGWALLRRDMEYGKLAPIAIVSSIAHSAVAIGLAYLGYGYMSLAWASIAGLVTTILMVRYHRAAQIWLMPTLRGARHILSFGTFSTLRAIASSIGMQSTDLILGRTIGMEGVGLWGRANGLLEFFNRAVMGTVGGVALPYFAASAREGAGFKERYLAGTTLITALAFPFFSVLGILAYPTVHVLYGDQWDASVPVVQWIALAYLTQCPFFLFSSALTALGRMKVFFYIDFGTIAVQVPVVIVVSQYGLTAIAMVWVPLSFVRSVVLHLVVSAVVGYSVPEFAKALTKSLGVTAMASIGPALVTAFMHIRPGNIMLPFLVGTTTAAAGWLGGIYLLRHPMTDEIKRAIAMLKEQM